MKHRTYDNFALFLVCVSPIVVFAALIPIRHSWECYVIGLGFFGYMCGRNMFDKVIERKRNQLQLPKGK